MRLARFEGDTGPRLGAVLDDEIVDLTEALSEPRLDPVAAAAGGPELSARVDQVLARGRSRRPVADVRLLPPVASPSKFIAVGLNYADHVEEAGLEAPRYPDVFVKFPSSLNGPYEPVQRPRVSDRLDYEGELGFVIGRAARHVARDDARTYIAGYVIVNDFSVRDWQTRTGQWSLGKSFDTHGPVGPWLVTTDELEDPHGLGLRTTVNGETRQSSNTRHLIHDCYDLVATLSSACTLLPGDIVTTGTPAGVGALATPPSFLVPGDVVRVEIEGIGNIENTVIDEPPAAEAGSPAAAGVRA